MFPEPRAPGVLLLRCSLRSAQRVSGSRGGGESGWTQRGGGGWLGAGSSLSFLACV